MKYKFSLKLEITLISHNSLVTLKTTLVCWWNLCHSATCSISLKLDHFQNLSQKPYFFNLPIPSNSFIFKESSMVISNLRICSYHINTGLNCVISDLQAISIVLNQDVLLVVALAILHQKYTYQNHLTLLNATFFPLVLFFLSWLLGILLFKTIIQMSKMIGGLSSKTSIGINIGLC